MSLIIKLRLFAESLNHNTYVSNDMNLLQSWNSIFIYRYKFSDNKLTELSITDINLNEIKDTLIQTYISKVNDRITELLSFKNSLKTFIDDNILSEYEFPEGITEEEYNELRRTYLMNHMSSSVYDFVYGE